MTQNNEDFSTWTVRTRFRIGDVVYLKCCSEPDRGMVTVVCIRPDGIGYWVTWGSGTDSQHFDFELSKEFVPQYEEVVSEDE